MFHTDATKTNPNGSASPSATRQIFVASLFGFGLYNTSDFSLVDVLLWGLVDGGFLVDGKELIEQPEVWIAGLFSCLLAFWFFCGCR